MNPLLGAQSGEAVRCSAWLAVGFLACCLLIGICFGLLIGAWRLRRSTEITTGGSGVNHVSELLKGLKLFFVQLLAVCGVRARLLLLKLQLLVKKALLKLELLPQQLLLKWVRDAWREPHAEESAKDGRAHSGKEKLVCHRRVVTTANDPSSATRRTGRNDCNHDAMPGSLQRMVRPRSCHTKLSPHATAARTSHHTKWPESK